jgi:hypothetical protein
MTFKQLVDECLRARRIKKPTDQDRAKAERDCRKVAAIMRTTPQALAASWK